MGCTTAVLIPHCVTFIPIECEDWNLSPAKAGRWRSSGLWQTTQAAEPFLPHFIVQDAMISTPRFQHQACVKLFTGYSEIEQATLAIEDFIPATKGCSTCRKLEPWQVWKTSPKSSHTQCNASTKTLVFLTIRSCCCYTYAFVAVGSLPNYLTFCSSISLFWTNTNQNNISGLAIVNHPTTNCTQQDPTIFHVKSVFIF